MCLKYGALRVLTHEPFWDFFEVIVGHIFLTILKVHFGHVFDLLEGRVLTFSSLEIVTFELWIC